MTSPADSGARPDAVLAAVAGAHADLLADLRATDFDPAAPSLLPDWTLGHVVTHIARNADSFTHLAGEAARGVVGVQYPGGFAQRRDDIAAGAARARDALVDDAAGACERLDAAFASLDDAVWRSGRSRVTGGEQPITALPWRRWRETMVHHTDLGFGYTIDDFPDTFVDGELPQLVATLPDRLPEGITVALVVTETGVCLGAGDLELRAPRHALLAWLMRGRDLDGAPPLRPW